MISLRTFGSLKFILPRLYSSVILRKSYSDIWFILIFKFWF